MRLRNVYFLGFFFTMLIPNYAQQDPLFSQYMFNQLGFNAAYAGSENKIVSSLIYRHQWLGSQYSPQSQVFSIHAPFNQRRNGVGLQVVNSSNFIINYTQASFYYAYKIIVAKGLLSMGLNGGIYQVAINFNNALIKDTDDMKLQNLSSTSYVRPDFGAGLYYQRDRFYFGLAFQHLFPLYVKVARYDYNYRSVHLYLNGGYKAKLSELVEYIISGLYKQAFGYGVQVDVSQHLIMNNQYWLGVSYRTNETLALQTGFKADKIITKLRHEVKLGYAFDWNFNFPQPSHELMLIINWQVHKSPEKILKQKIQLSPFFL